MKNVSATQISAFQDCARKWYLRYVKGIETLKTNQQVLGSGIHKALELYLKTGKILDDEFKSYVEAAVPYLPAPSKDNLIELEFFLPTFDGGPKWHGFIDLLIDEDVPVVHDHKTTSDFRYAKTPAEMERDTQLCSYAKYVQSTQIKHLGSPTNVIGRLLYLHTRRKTLEKRSMLVETTLTPTTVNAIWKRDLEIVRQMVVVREAASVEDLPPTTSSCMKYGGCAYRTQCGLAIETNPGRKRAMDMSSFLERMKAQQTATSGNGTAAVIPGQAGIPQIVPPDAASPITTTTATQATTEPTKRGRPQLTDAEKEVNKKKRAAERMLEKARKAQEEAEAAAAAATAPANPPVQIEQTPAASESAPESTPTPTQTSTPNGKGFSLYIDCYPVKGGDQTRAVVLFDDWITSVVHDINSEVEVLDYRLLGFAQEKLALQAGLEKHIETVPPVLIVSTTSSIAKDALQTLIPHAREVVRAMR